MVKLDLLDLTFSKVPMLKPLLGLIFGIILGHFFDFSFISYLPAAIFICFLTLIISLFKCFKSSRMLLFSIPFYTFMILMGVWIISVHKPTVNSKHFSHYNGAQLVGVIIDEPIYNENTIRFPLSINMVVDSNAQFKVQGKVMVTLWRDSMARANFFYGDEITIKNLITEVGKPLNPNEFDYNKYLAAKNIYYQVFLRDTDFKINDHDKGNYILGKSLAIRQMLICKFSKFIKAKEAYPMAIALIFGYRSQLDVNTLEAFTNTGTIHVLSVSGLHVGLVFGLLSLLLFWLDRYRSGKIIRSTLIFVAVWIYVILTGMSPSIMRAGIMISFFLVASVFGRRQFRLNTLFASALFILLFNPQYVFDVGFKLSYTAILGILVLLPFFKAFWSPKNRWLRLLVEYCYVSMAAQLFTLPFTLYYFGQFPVYFLIANLFIAIPIIGIMYLGVTMAVLYSDFVNVLIGKLLDGILVFVLKGLKFISHLPMSVIKGVEWNLGQAICLALLLLLLVMAFNFGNKRILYGALVFLFTLTVYTVNQQVRSNFYVGGRIYSLRSELAIAYIDRSNVTLYTTLDSLQHPLLKFSVLPDLLHYENEKNINFVHIKNDKRRNYSLTLGNRQFLILEDNWEMKDSLQYDFIVWRKNNRNNLADFLRVRSNILVIIDGSNSLYTIEKMKNDIQNTRNTYLLKNNFAYVWEGD